jgi:transposase-like protein
MDGNTGRHCKLTPELQADIVRRVAAGNYPAVAAKSAGIARTTFYRWMAEARKNVKEAKAIENLSDPGRFYQPSRDYPSGGSLPDSQASRESRNGTLPRALFIGSRKSRNGEFARPRSCLDVGLPRRMLNLSSAFHRARFHD